MTQIYIPGPAGIYTNTGALGVFEFGGFSEGDVRITVDAAFEDIHTDVSGPRIPFDVLSVAEQAFISGTLIQYTEAWFGKMSDRRHTGFPGSIMNNDIGTLMITEGKTIQLWIDAPYSIKSPYNTMVQGYGFNAAYVADAMDIDMGTRPKKARILWRALPLLQANFLSNPGVGGPLYYNTRPTLPAIS